MEFALEMNELKENGTKKADENSVLYISSRFMQYVNDFIGYLLRLSSLAPGGFGSNPYQGLSF